MLWGRSNISYKLLIIRGVDQPRRALSSGAGAVGPQSYLGEAEGGIVPVVDLPAERVCQDGRDLIFE